MDGMSFLLFFFEKNNIIKPKMDGMNFLLFFFEKNNILSKKRMIWVFCYSF